MEAQTSYSLISPNDIYNSCRPSAIGSKGVKITKTGSMITSMVLETSYGQQIGADLLDPIPESNIHAVYNLVNELMNMASKVPPNRIRHMKKDGSIDEAIGSELGGDGYRKVGSSGKTIANKEIEGRGLDRLEQMEQSKGGEGVANFLELHYSKKTGDDKGKKKGALFADKPLQKKKDGGPKKLLEGYLLPSLDLGPLPTYAKA